MICVSMQDVEHPNAVLRLGNTACHDSSQFRDVALVRLPANLSQHKPGSSSDAVWLFLGVDIACFSKIFNVLAERGLADL